MTQTEGNNEVRMDVSHDTQSKVREIKQSFRLYMNGVTADSLKAKGYVYKINWGVSAQHLNEIAAEYGKDYDLAIELWKSNVRECKLLATLVMPAEKMLPEVAEIWMDESHTQELAEMLAFNLYQHMPAAPDLAFRWMADKRDLHQICAYNILSRLFSAGQVPDVRAMAEYIDQALAALHSSNISLRHAAMNSLNRFASLGDEYEHIVSSALEREGF